MSDYLKPHTIVKIRSDLKPGLYGDHCITNNMLKYGGQLATITEVVKLDNGPDKYLYGISHISFTFLSNSIITLFKAIVIYY